MRRPTPLQGAGVGGSHLLDKQSLVPAVQELWNAWEIQFLIVLSLSLQVFLFLFADMRRRSSNCFLRTTLWLGYLSADSVAVFVLGHLAVRAREPGHQLVAFWAPFVLVHLGGQYSMTAFSKQDNELWVRHLLNLVIQAGVAGYVVAKASWPDARLRAAMVIMFACGCLKYAERVFCLYLADTERLRRWNQSLLTMKLEGRQHERGKDLLSRSNGTRDKAEENMRVTLEMMKKGSQSEPPNGLFWDAVTLVSDIISVDAPLNQTQNITVGAYGDLLPGMLKGFLSTESRHSAYQHVGELLEYCYRRLYTKDILRLSLIQSFDVTPSPILKTCLRISSLAILLLMLFSTLTATAIALALFRAAEKGGQLHASSRVDIMVTYLLLVGAIALDVSTTAIFIFHHLSFHLPSLAKPIAVVACCCTEQWSQELGQYSVINTAGMSCIWQLLGCDVKRTPITKDNTSIKEFILDTLLVSGTRKEWSIASTRGRLALQKWMDRHKNDDNQRSFHHLAATMTLKSLRETVKSSTDFPTSVLILHIATDICYNYGGTNSDDQTVKKHKHTSTQLSKYIMYLVFKCDVMLTTNSQIVHESTRNDIAKKDMVFFEAIKKQQQEDSVGEIQIRDQELEEDSTIEMENEESTDIDDDNVAHMKKLKRSSKTLKSPVLPRAVAVAQELISIKEEAERWDLIAAVWAEMLYYTAPRCGGGFHYEHLSTGGEFITHVLLLMYYLGPFLPPPPDA